MTAPGVGLLGAPLAATYAIPVAKFDDDAEALAAAARRGAAAYVAELRLIAAGLERAIGQRDLERLREALDGEGEGLERGQLVDGRVVLGSGYDVTVVFDDRLTARVSGGGLGETARLLSVLDRALTHDSPSVVASGPESRDASSPIVGAAPAVVPSATPGAQAAPSPSGAAASSGAPEASPSADTPKAGAPEHHIGAGA